MDGWHRSRKADIVLRCAGALLCRAAYLAWAHLVAWPRGASDNTADMLAVALAAVAFLGASAGSAMLCLGRHLFDDVRISARWQRRRAWPGPAGDMPPRRRLG